MKISKKKLKEILNRFAGIKLIVWGDFILDEYITGVTNRISREAPALILSFRNREFFLGGAGNTVRNLKALGAEPLPIGVIGQDKSSEIILQKLKEENIPTKYMFILPDFSTPRKTRILAGEETARKQQILRLDYEEKVSYSPSLRKTIVNNLKTLIKSADGMIISDYNYLSVDEDIFNEILPGCRQIGLPITLDSRFRLLNFKGITALTPNESEVEEALGTSIPEDHEKIKRTGRMLLKKTASESVLLTRGSKGMVLFEKRKSPFYIPVHGTTDIVDGTGAGDTVISVFSLALTCGAGFREAAFLSNLAGAVVVMKRGTAVCSLKELEEVVFS